MPNVSAGGVALHYSIVGGRPSVVFIHGGWPGLHTALQPNDLDTVEPWERQLGERFGLLRYARRGYSPSDVTFTGYDLDNQVTDLLTVIDSVGVDKVHVIASSSGGSIGCAFAGGHPNRTATLTLVGTGPDLRTTLAPRPRLLATLEQLLDDLDRLGPDEAARQRPPEIAVSIDPLFMRDEIIQRGDGPAYEDQLRRWSDQAKRISPPERARWLEAELRAVAAYLAWDGIQAARRITAPTLVLHGARDRAILASEGSSSPEASATRDSSCMKTRRTGSSGATRPR